MLLRWIFQSWECSVGNGFEKSIQNCKFSIQETKRGRRRGVHQGGLCWSRTWGSGCDCVAGGRVKRPLYIDGMTGKELTVFIPEPKLTGFECIISSAKTFQPNSAFLESQLALLAGTCGEAIEV